LEHVEVGIRSSPSGDRIKLEQSIATELSPSTVSILTTLFERFEAIAGQVEAEQLAAHRNFCQKQLHPLLLCSPFLYRCFHKPLGYAGDYEMVNMIMGNPYEGSSLFAKLVNTWFIQQPPAQAHRNRILHLVDRISRAAARISASGKAVRVFSLGCGPAHEVQLFLREKDFANHAQFTLVDFNQETIEHASQSLERLKSEFGRTTSIHMVKKSVNQILKDAGKSINRSPEQQYDLVYCAGLYDYLTNPICKRLSNILYDWVAPGGSLVLTNVDISNPRKITMDLIMEWSLFYRTGAQMVALKPESAPEDQCKIVSDLSGVNLYLEIGKPERP
jgi:extracellular factor (EF) 3-hydroxypalmitic acid methyl ester biosynthesis protein